MAHGIDEIDLTPPEIIDDYFLRWLIENFSRVKQTLINGFTGSIIVGDYTHEYEFGVLETRRSTAVFSSAFSAAYK